MISVDKNLDSMISLEEFNDAMKIQLMVATGDTKKEK